MPDHPLAAAYLDRLADELSLPEAESDAAIEEIAAHLELATAELVGRGTPLEDAMRQSLARLGAPERLARDLNAAHRRPRDLLTATGVALRVSLVSAIRTYLLAWIVVIGVAFGAGAALSGLRALLGTRILDRDWSPILDGLLPAVVALAVSFAVGRALLAPVAVAARRAPAEVRPALLVIGAAVVAGIAIGIVEARWTLPSAVLMAAAPLAFLAGVLRPRTVPSVTVPTGGLAIGVAGVLVLSLAAVAGLGAIDVQTFETAGRAFDPNEEYAAIGRFVDIEHPPLVLRDEEAASVAASGAGPIRVERRGTFVVEPTWTDLRLEVWLGPPGELNGPVVDPSATEPIVAAPARLEGRRLEASVEFFPLPERAFYAVAITGVDELGERVQLAWPSYEFSVWRGTVANFFVAAWR
jgi:hypothetical protein